MGIKSIGHGLNRRRQNNAPWWARNIKAVVGFLGLVSAITLAFFSYATWLVYLLLQSLKLWFKGLIQHGQAFQDPTHLGLTWSRVLDWTKAWPGNQLNNPWLIWGLLLGVIALSLSWYRIIRSYQSYNGFEKGAETFSSPDQLKKEYELIPDRNKSFPGYGGIPLVHYNRPVGSLIQSASYSPLFQKTKKKLAERFTLLPSGTYGIDQTTVNSLIYGITRSGKGVTEVEPLIDILSRAEKQASMEVNDPKLELFTKSKRMLERRGYRVYVLNLQNMAKSMSYNPLQVVVDYARRGYYDEAQREANRISSAIYQSNDDGGNSKFWNNSSVNLLNALILSQLDMAVRHNSWNRVTMNNIYRELTELGGQEIQDDASLLTTRLSYYFKKMAQIKNKTQLQEMALEAFQQSNFAGDETAGNIYASMMEGIKIYQQRDIAQLTSMNSLDFRTMAFPRRLRVGFGQQLSLQTVYVIFYDDKGNEIEQRSQMIDRLGFLDFPIKAKLPRKYRIKIDFNHDLTDPELRKYHYCYQGTIKTHKRSPLDKGFKEAGKVTLEPLQSVILNDEEQQITFDYSEQPVALFLGTPPHNPSYNQLVSFAIDQSFNQMYQMALDNEKKCYTRVHFIIDEGGNLPKIQDLPTKFSIGLGSELLFDWVLQNKAQLRINYTKEEAETIISNCGNTLYILSKDKETAQEISDEVGHTTVNVMGHQLQGNVAELNGLNSNLDAVPVISMEELLRLRTGEMVVVRSTARTDQRGRIIRANPIFDTGKTRMPASWQFLNQTLDNKATIYDINVNTPHKRLMLKSLQYDYASDENDSELNQMIQLANEAPTRSAQVITEPATTASEELRQQLAQEKDWGALQKQLMACVDYQSSAYVEIRDLAVDAVASYVLAHLKLYEKCIRKRVS
ncbi:type IV secretory system conjugative DNA transfer family protein [Lactiplantibacillus plantarum]|uniref:VirD4-like conjugal transfer protein, CD1115 family n=1 Tax=Lactiplantibacillus plantarum TaxID=1590 RepID=UPI000FFF5C45|nr:type IV secretory system conjugative DNA transfer family protein [Lactiplantibacillus plantarum]MCG0574584.1 conjugal transfer protein TraG [Lactiplantibacillus plantarum]MCG0945722.1 conjugal transfer protein TraG [Lactiplantibacillus plantarum]MDP4437293.1 type IV secretory system conjugative DNA transfer family protein [Lactiplantibacillus plantarum]MDP4440864.1 type IV secretory system conjugative DNA transfer family protein [Lactiplantibacillus plantarum]MDP4459461.1 type IV secretory 